MGKAKEILFETPQGLCLTTGSSGWPINPAPDESLLDVHEKNCLLRLQLGSHVGWITAFTLGAFYVGEDRLQIGVGIFCHHYRFCGVSVWILQPKIPQMLEQEGNKSRLAKQFGKWKRR